MNEQVVNLMQTANTQPIPILTYHQIAKAPPKGFAFRSLYVEPHTFKRQMQMLKLLGFQGLSMRDLMPYLRGEKKGKVVGITLDDGYLNNLTEALPVLLEYKFTATCYVVSQLLGKSNSWDHGIGIQPAPLMDAHEVRIWSRAGMEIGAHTRHHVNLCQSPNEVLESEIKGSRMDLEDILGQVVDQFCYPFGIYNLQHIPMVQEAGFIAATTTNRGQTHCASDLFQLRRIPIVKSSYWPQFLLKILTGYENKYLEINNHGSN